MNTLIYFLALGDLKAVGASFSQIMTAIMVSRLQLNLRPSTPTGNVSQSTRAERFVAKTNRTASSVLFTSVDFTDDTRSTAVLFFTVGNLREALGRFNDEKPPEEMNLEDFNGRRA